VRKDPSDFIKVKNPIWLVLPQFKTSYDSKYVYTVPKEILELDYNLLGQCR